MRSSSCRRLVSTVVQHDLRPSIVGHSRRQADPPASLGVRNENGAASGPVHPRHQQQIRGKKTKTTINFADLPQGPIKPPETPLSSVQDGQEEGPAYPTVVLQARRNMAKFENCVLLTRVGGFYELYFEHAEEYGPLLNLKVASKKTNAGPVSMAGFPFFQLDRFLKILVQEHNCYVAVAEEFPNDASDKVRSNGLMHDRKVARIITPGTLIDENFIDPYANNYVMAIHLDQSVGNVVVAETAPAEEQDKKKEQPLPSLATVGLAWLDISTGQFYTQSATIAGLSSILSRVGPREIVIEKGLQSQEDHTLFTILAEDKHLITFTPHDTPLPTHEWAPMLESKISASTAKNFTADEVFAGSILLQYVRDRLLGLSMKLQPPIRHESLQVLTIDKNSMRSLEIKQTIRDGAFKGSLLHAIRRTVTKSGARLLNDWVSAPSTCLETITQRQELVEYFIQNTDLRDLIVQLLRRSHDSQRLVQKFAFGRGDPDDLVGLANTIHATEEIVQLLSSSPPSANSDSHPFDDLLKRISLADPAKLADRIRSSIDEDGLSAQHQLEDSEAGQLLSLASDIVSNEATSEEAATILPKSTASKIKRSVNGKPASIRDHYDADNPTFTMKPGASPALSNLHGELNKLLQERIALTTTLSVRFSAPSLTLRWAPNLGHILHVKGKDTKQIPPTFPPLTSSRSTRTFSLPEWTSLGQSLHQVRFAISTEETRIFASLRERVVRNLIKLRRNASVLDELDVATSFARLAAENGLVRPVLSASPSSSNNTSHKIIGGRHPTVELGLRVAGRSFSPNDCLVGAPSQGRLWLITGPNMAGKSTYLRQNALITILAQTGCFVPAAHAEIGVVDAIFSRVGSADNLYNDQSTFMVEMLETAQILRCATSRSFVIMDEIGRGTTPDDGTAVAFAALWHLVKINKCRTLFATHFHELADLIREKEMHVDQGGEVECYCTDVAEDGQGGFVYVHKLRKGVNRRSHALKVAKLAGLPEAAITVAKGILGSST
ncbi:muts domain V [Truncatella angustata]|uniref:Muts domain V n=1 Tax=Truncatella angustata TaxID=152316 RepID=A0A9P8U9L2_9PEZI|nr:muts domain V [Truncatella angustata]KAH6646429.1 muts domain V [Truncatella angustata]